MMTFGGTRRTIVWNDMDSGAPVTVYDRGVDRVPDCAQVAGQPGVTYRSGKVHVPELPTVEALRSVMSEFAAAIMERRAPLTDGSAGVRMLSVLEAASRSAAGGGIRIPIEIQADQATVACMVPLSASLGPALRVIPAAGGRPARDCLP
jgi:predicted dehydrogenase